MPEAGAMGDAAARACQLFVYYRVDEADLSAVVALVHGFQADLRAEFPALHATLMRRPGATAGQVTLMESGHLAGAPPERLRAQLTQGPAALQAWLRSERHLEEFVPCA